MGGSHEQESKSSRRLLILQEKKSQKHCGSCEHGTSDGRGILRDFSNSSLDTKKSCRLEHMESILSQQNCLLAAWTHDLTAALSLTKISLCTVRQVFLHRCLARLLCRRAALTSSDIHGVEGQSLTRLVTDGARRSRTCHSPSLQTSTRSSRSMLERCSPIESTRAFTSAWKPDEDTALIFLDVTSRVGGEGMVTARQQTT